MMFLEPVVALLVSGVVVFLFVAAVAELAFRFYLD